ncbi:MAG: UDP-N-acetylmuramoyl-tripeptide--D-alanyl-D-alanine ligase [Candidatus Latescibacterota bacterium]
MTDYTLRQMLAAIGADAETLSETLLNRTPAGVSTDTRTVRPGDVFFGIRGDRFDGSAFAGKALESGAILAVVNEGAALDIDKNAPVVRVPDTIRALGDAARDYRSRFRGPVFAITGTNGKTTVKEMLRATLGTRFRVHATAGNLNNHIGLPLSVFGLEDGHECAVFELGMSAPGEIGYLAGIARPDFGIILNVGPGHMEFFESIEDVAEAKTELLRALSPRGAAVLNGDDPRLRARENGCSCRIVRFGIETSVDFRGEEVKLGSDGCASFRVEGFPVHLRVPGVHNVYNALAAWTAGRLAGLDGKEIVYALENFSAPKMRMQNIIRDGVCYINDSYNANPLSMRAAAEVLRVVRIPEGGRLVAVLGDMRELGLVAAEAHREIGKIFGSLRPSLLFLVGEQAALYREGALLSGMDAGGIHAFRNAEEALPAVSTVKRPGDVIFIKGSRALGMERFISDTDGKS